MTGSSEPFSEHGNRVKGMVGVTVSVTVDGKAMRLGAHGSVAGALLEAGIRRLRASPRDGAPRGAFCFMGACQECAIFIDGRLAQACLVAPREGMSIALAGVP
jgi:predicted molibdopterin-dependent oxidoreductase YjgC